MQALPTSEPTGPSAPDPARLRAPTLAAGLALLALGACGRGEPPPADVEEPAAAVDAPGGAVLLVEGQAVFPDDVADLQADIAALYPEYSPIHVLRLTLTNDTLPRLAMRAAHPEQWSRALQTCTNIDLEQAEEQGLVRRVDGNFRALGLNLWSLARDLPLGQWSEPIELTGRFVRVRVEKIIAANDPRIERLHVSLIEFPVVTPARLDEYLDAAIDGARLTLLDPLFSEAVPETWKHRMHARSP